MRVAETDCGVEQLCSRGYGKKVIMKKLTGAKDGVVRVVGYGDSDWAGGRAARKSRSSGHIEADGCPMEGFSRRQAIIGTSSGIVVFLRTMLGCRMFVGLQGSVRVLRLSCRVESGS